MHEQEVSQIRSESRAGLYDDDLDEEDEKPGAGPNEADRWRGVQVANQRGSFIRKPGTTPSRAYSERDASMDRDSGLSTDTSGTEGAGSTTSRRRHKKSSDDGRRELASARRNRESRLAADREGGSAQGSTSFRSLRARNGTPSSPLSEELSIEPSVGGRRYSPRRNGIPREFLYQDERQPLGADRDVEDEEDADALEGRSMESSGTAGRSSRATQAWTSGNRRKRYPSDAGTASDPIPQFDYGGRGGSQESRLSVDSSLAYRYLTRGGGAASSLGLGRLVDPPEGEEEDGVRSRKVSTSSSISARSSGGASASASASELHRSASRASMRLAHRRDVFDDEAPVSPFGPNVSTAQQRSPLRDGRAMGERERMERIRELRESGERLRLREKEGGAGRAGWVNELDEVSTLRSCHPVSLSQELLSSARF